MLLDIVILPPVHIRRRLGRLARQLVKEYPSFYVIDNRRLIPHISLYHFVTSYGRLPQVAKAVELAIRGVQPLVISGSELNKGRHSAELILKNTPAINKLNRAVLAECAPLRTGVMPGMFERKKTKETRRAIKNYGTVGTVVNFEPHVTLLANFRSAKTKDYRGRLGRVNVKFQAREVAIAEVNRWYQVTRILKRFRV